MGLHMLFLRKCDGVLTFRMSFAIFPSPFQRNCADQAKLCCCLFFDAGFYVCVDAFYAKQKVTLKPAAAGQAPYKINPVGCNVW